MTHNYREVWDDYAASWRVKTAAEKRALYQRSLILKDAVECEKDVHDIDVNGGFDKLVVTLLVMRDFSDSLGARVACAYNRNPNCIF